MEYLNEPEKPESKIICGIELCPVNTVCGVVACPVNIEPCGTNVCGTNL